MDGDMTSAAARRPAVRGAASALVAALVVAGCTAPGPATSASDAVPTTIRLLMFGGPEERAAYQEVATAFHAQRPDLNVVIDAVAGQDELLARLTTGFAGGNPPDVFLVNFRRYGQFAALGALQPVQPLIEVSDVIDLADFFEEPLTAFRYDGGDLSCLPQNVSSLVTYVNLDLFEAAGLDVPFDGLDWNTLVEVATALTDADSGVYGLGTSPSLVRLAPLVWSTGAELVDDMVAPTRLTLDDFPQRDALDFLLDLNLVHEVTPPDLAEQARGSHDRFLDGDLAMLWSSRIEVPTFRTITDFAWDVVPFPIAPGGRDVTMLHSDAFCLPAGLDTTDAAWAFVEFASTVPGQTILAESGRTVPSRIDVAASAAFLRNDVPPTHAQVFLDNIQVVRATPSTASWNEVERRADDILEAAFYGRISREDARARLRELSFAPDS